MREGHAIWCPGCPEVKTPLGTVMICIEDPGWLMRIIRDIEKAGKTGVWRRPRYLNRPDEEGVEVSEYAKKSGKWVKPPVFCGNSLVEGGFTGEYRSPAKSEFHAKVRKELNEVEDLLVEKNEAYGNSALDPINVFSKASSIEQLKVRIDDKLNRLYHGKEYGQEDTVTDLIGYLVLLKIAEKEQSNE